MEQATVTVGVVYERPDRDTPGWAAARSYQGVAVRGAPPSVPELFYSGDPVADFHAAWEALAPWIWGLDITTSRSVEHFVADTGGWYTLDEDGMLAVEGAPGALRAAAA